MALALSGVSFGAMISGYLLVVRQSDWSSNSLAAQHLALQCSEQVRGTKWDPMASPPVDEVVASNFPDQIEPLGVPVVGTNVALASVHTTIQSVSTDPPLKLVRVDCIWSYRDRGTYTNTVFTYRSPDQ